MRLHLDQRFTLSSDRYNWILTEKQEGKKMKWHFFPSIKKLSGFIGELVAKEALGKSRVELGNIGTITPSCSSVIDEISVKLEEYIDSIVEGEKTKHLK